MWQAMYVFTTAFIWQPANTTEAGWPMWVATLNSQISVPATAGYTQFAVRAYNPHQRLKRNNNLSLKKGGVANDGAIGATEQQGRFPVTEVYSHQDRLMSGMRITGIRSYI